MQLSLNTVSPLPPCEARFSSLKNERCLKYLYNSETEIKLILTDTHTHKKNKIRERIFTVKILDVLFQAAVYRFY